MLVVLAEIVDEDSTLLGVIDIGDSIALVAGASSLARLLSRGLGLRLGNRNRDRVDGGTGCHYYDLFREFKGLIVQYSLGDLNGHADYKHMTCIQVL